MDTLTDIELTKRCAEAMGLAFEIEDGRPTVTPAQRRVEDENRPSQFDYDPLHDDAQAMELVARLKVACIPYSGNWECSIAGPSETCKAYASGPDLRRAIVQCVASMTP